MADKNYKLKFTLTDGKTQEVEFTAPQGPKGDQGIQGIQGPAGAKGDKGDQGIQGIQGPKGDKGDTGATGPQGPAGEDGKDGASGTSVTVKSVSESSTDGGNNVVTFSNGKTVTIKNGTKGSTGSQGPKGDTGAPGVSGVYILNNGESMSNVPSTANVVIDPSSEGVFDVHTQIAQLQEEKANKSGLTLGVHTDGLVYIFIDGAPHGNGLDIKADVVEGDVFGYVDENNVIVLNGALAEGTYTIKYEMDNGDTVEIGDLVLDTNVYYTVTNTLTQCTTNNSATKAVQGGSYSATITAKSGYELSSVKVTMGGTDISSTAVSGGKITISNVTGNIVITAVATEVATTPKGNLANPTSADWGTNKRLAGSYGYAKDSTGFIFTNYIPVKAGDVLRVKGLNLYGIIDSTHSSVGIYTSKDTSADSTGRLNAYQRYRCTSVAASSSNEGAKEKVAKNGDIFTYTILLHGDGTQTATSETAYARISAPLMDGYTAEDVIITINEEITDSGNGGTASAYTNLLPLAVDASGNDYKGTNGEDGYKSGYKISTSSGNESATSGACVSGFIPLNGGIKVRIKNISVSSSASVNNLVFYDASKTRLSGLVGTAGAFTSNVTVTNGVYLVDLAAWFSRENLPAFIRFSCGGITSDTIVTVDEEIGGEDSGDTVPLYTNLLPSAIDTDGSAYGNSKGYVSGYKLSCSSSGGTPSATTGAYVSGFMPLSHNLDKIRIKNITLHANASVNNIIFYNKDKTKLYAVGGVAGGFAALVDVEDGNVYRFSPGSWLSTTQAENIGFFRFSCGGITDKTIVTVNEEIV